VSRFRGRFKDKAERCILTSYAIPSLGELGVTAADVQERVKYLLEEGNYRFKNPDAVGSFR